MLCLKKRRTYSFTQGVCADLPRRSKKDNNRYEGSLNMAITTLPRKNRSREERPSRMVLTVTEDTPADMLAGSMELLVHLPRDHHLQTQRVTVQRSTPMMDLLVQIATAHKLAASNYTLQAIGERGLVLPHQPNTPIGALDALQVKLLPKQGTFVPRKLKPANQPFETTFRLQVHLPRNQLYVSRVSPKMNLGEILDEVCREKNLDRNKYELRHPANIDEVLDLSLSLQDYHLQEVTLYAKQGRTLGSALSSQDIMALQRQEERRRQQAKQGVFGFMFKKSKEGSLSTDSLGGRSASPARSDETGRSASPIQPPARPQRKRRPAPKPPIQIAVNEENGEDSGKDKVVISHSRNSSDSSGYHESSVLSDNPDSAGRLPETLPRRGRAPGTIDTPRKLAQTSQSSKSLGNLATVSGTLSHGISSTSLSSTGLRKKRAAPPPPVSRPLSSAISTQALERIVDSEESLTSDIDPSKPPSDIGIPSKASSDIEDRPKASSDIGVSTKSSQSITNTKKNIHSSEGDRADDNGTKMDVVETRRRSGSINVKLRDSENVEKSNDPPTNVDVPARVTTKRVGEPAPLPKPRKTSVNSGSTPPKVPKRRLAPLSAPSRSFTLESNVVNEHLVNKTSYNETKINHDRSSTYDVSLRPDESNGTKTSEIKEIQECNPDESSCDFRQKMNQDLSSTSHPSDESNGTKAKIKGIEEFNPVESSCNFLEKTNQDLSSMSHRPDESNVTKTSEIKEIKECNPDESSCNFRQKTNQDLSSASHRPDESNVTKTSEIKGIEEFNPDKSSCDFRQKTNQDLSSTCESILGSDKCNTTKTIESNITKTTENKKIEEFNKNVTSSNFCEKMNQDLSSISLRSDESNVTKTIQFEELKELNVNEVSCNFNLDHDLSSIEKTVESKKVEENIANEPVYCFDEKKAKDDLSSTSEASLHFEKISESQKMNEIFTNETSYNFDEKRPDDLNPAHEVSFHQNDRKIEKESIELPQTFLTDSSRAKESFETENCHHSGESSKISETSVHSNEKNTNFVNSHKNCQEETRTLNADNKENVESIKIDTIVETKVHRVELESFENSSNDEKQPDLSPEIEKPPRVYPKRNKLPCAVISTLPKCDHLDVTIDPQETVRLKYEKTLETIKCQSFKREMNDGSIEDNQNRDNCAQNHRMWNQIKEDTPMHVMKRGKICRSESKSNDFETNSLGRQKRHMTSHAEDITFALNLNLSSNIDFSKNSTREQERSTANSVEELNNPHGLNGENSQHGVTMGISGTEKGLSDTDILLQKVSDTLSNNLPILTSNETSSTTIERRNIPFVSNSNQTTETFVKRSNLTTPTKGSNERSKDTKRNGLNVSVGNVTLNSQQDTSDYVSAGDEEDLSLTDWEYQLPAPPSAFRDTASPVFDVYDRKETTNEITEGNAINNYQKSARTIWSEEEETQKTDTFLHVDKTEKLSKSRMKAEKTDSNLSLKKEIINELENKLGNGTLQSGTKEDPRRIVESTPKIAPIDNTLSNFTITTYTKEKSLNIFDESHSQNNNDERKCNDERFVSTFATLSRGRNHTEKRETSEMKRTDRQDDRNFDEVDYKKSEPKNNERLEYQERWRDENKGKVNVERSKSYVSTIDTMKNHDSETDKRILKYESNQTAERNNTNLKKSTSIGPSNALPRNNEKFSQWRENILKRQEEPTKEKQLQSLQVLKSILPQLKSAQQAEESVPKEQSGAVLTEKTRPDIDSTERSTESNVSLARQPDPKRLESDTKKTEDKNLEKRYTYKGPPAISLGSWSERPSVNVQIKVDTDYKLGQSGKTTNGKTVVSINKSSDNPSYVHRITSEKIHTNNTEKQNVRTENTERKITDESTKKFNVPLTGFKKPTLNHVCTSDSTKLKVSEKPVVTGVELKKKNFIETSETKQQQKKEEEIEESNIDTRPVNFKELTKAFGQDVCLRAKPKRINPNRRSEDLTSLESQSIERNNLFDGKQQNGHANFEKLPTNSTCNNPINGTANSEIRGKRFTSIVGINTQNNGQNGHFVFRNNLNATKNNPPMPVVKGFKVTSAANSNVKVVGTQNGVMEGSKGGTQPPKPPTMPVITGVTLKSASARPKSMPVQIDPRNILLESIRNFGGRENLKSAAERC